MDKNNNENNYLAARRRLFLWILFAIGIFGLVLYVLSVVQNYVKENNVEIFDDVKNNSVAFLKDIFNFFPDSDAEKKEKNNAAEKDKSANILKVPLLLDCTVRNERIFINSPFEVGGRKVSNAVFDFKRHGATIYSSGFYSKEGKVTCRGTMKEGAKQFFVYYCEEKRNG